MQENFKRLAQLDPGSGVVEETNSLAYFEGLSVRIAGTVIIRNIIAWQHGQVFAVLRGHVHWGVGCLRLGPVLGPPSD